MCEPTYRFHEIARVLANPSRRNRGVLWVFSPPVHCLQFSLRSTTRGPLAFAYVIEAQWGTHPDAGVTEGCHPPCAAATYQRGWAPAHWQSRFSMGLGNRPYVPHPEHTNRWTPIPLIRYPMIHRSLFYQICYLTISIHQSHQLSGILQEKWSSLMLRKARLGDYPSGAQSVQLEQE